MESQPNQSQGRGSHTKLLIVLSVLLIVPITVATVLITIYMVQGRQLPIVDARSQAPQIQLANAHGSMAKPPAETWRTRSVGHLHRISVSFDGFQPRQADALAVERIVETGQDSGYSYLVTPLAVFRPITNKLNGRVVTRNPGQISVGSQTESMASPTPGPPHLEVVRADLDTGLVLLRSSIVMDPIRVLGELPTVTSGQKLGTASGRSESRPAEVTVVAVNTSVTLPTGEILSNAIEITAWTGPLGALLINRAGQPVAMVMLNHSNRTFAMPIETIFRMADPEQLTAKTSHPELDTPAFDHPNGTSEPVLPSKMESLGELAATRARIRSTESFPPPFDPSDPVAEPKFDVPERVSDLPPDGADPFSKTLPPGAPSVNLPPIGTEDADNRAPYGRFPVMAEPGLKPDHVGPAHSADQREPLRPADDLSEPTGGRGMIEFDDRDAMLDREARQLALRIRTSKPEAKADLLKELQQLAERHFVYRQEHRTQQISELGQRLEKLRGTLQARETNRMEIVQRRVKELLDPRADLRWDETRISLDSETPKTSEKGQSATSPSSPEADSLGSKASVGDPSVKVIPLVEKTYDGVPYSQWLKMLETEQKPEKLSTAMDACSRLAAPGDEHRIVRGIFLGAGSFESGDEREQNQVWQAGWRALSRLPTSAIVDELLIAIRDRDSYQSGRRFQMRYLTERRSLPLTESLKSRERDFIQELVNLAREKGKDVGWLVAAACCIWEQSEVPLQEVAGFEPLVYQTIDEGLTVTYGGWNEDICPEWRFVATALINRNPGTPDLAVRLMKHAAKSRDVVKVIGKLGRHAEPAVPMLVDLFVKEWHKYEDDLNAPLNSRPVDHNETYRDHFRRRNLVEALGNIGVGQKGGKLLRELQLIAAPPRQRNDQLAKELFGDVEQAISKLGMISVSDSTPMLLRDSTLIGGVWTLQSKTPGIMPDNCFVRIQRGRYFSLFLSDRGQENYNKIEDLHIGNRFEINSTTSPGRISIYDVESSAAAGVEPRALPNSRREGLYKLTESTLRIQVSALGKPCPTEMVNDKSSLPVDQLLLEFVRKTGEISE